MLFPYALLTTEAAPPRMVDYKLIWKAMQSGEAVIGVAPTPEATYPPEVEEFIRKFARPASNASRVA